LKKAEEAGLVLKVTETESSQLSPTCYSLALMRRLAILAPAVIFVKRHLANFIARKRKVAKAAPQHSSQLCLAQKGKDASVYVAFIIKLDLTLSSFSASP
jgi:hypothetical protein